MINTHFKSKQIQFWHLDTEIILSPPLYILLVFEVTCIHLLWYQRIVIFNISLHQKKAFLKFWFNISFDSWYCLVTVSRLCQTWAHDKPRTQVLKPRFIMWFYFSGRIGSWIGTTLHIMLNCQNCYFLLSILSKNILWELFLYFFKIPLNDQKKSQKWLLSNVIVNGCM